MKIRFFLIAVIILLAQTNGITQRNDQTISINFGGGWPQFNHNVSDLNKTENTTLIGSMDMELKFPINKNTFWGISAGFSYLSKNLALKRTTNSSSIPNFGISVKALPIDLFIDRSYDPQWSKYIHTLSIGGSLTLLKFSQLERDIIVISQSFSYTLPQIDKTTQNRFGLFFSYNIKRKINRSLHIKGNFTGRYTRPFHNAWLKYSYSGLFFKIGIEKILHGA